MSKKDDKVDETEPYPVTDVAPSKDDQVAYVVGDADHEDSPVRTARPDVPVAAALASGAGEHKPADPEKFDRDGRPLGDIEVADNSEDSGAKARSTR